MAKVRKILYNFEVNQNHLLYEKQFTQQKDPNL